MNNARAQIARLVALMSAAASVTVFTQTPPSTRTVTFEVVSIKRNAGAAVDGSAERPDGGFVFRNVSIPILIARAYPASVPTPLSRLSGLPEWATLRGDAYDIIAKSPLSRPASPEERMAMTRALLADRFKLAVRLEKREQPVYDLVFARSDHRLGPNIKPSEPGCEEKAAAQRAEILDTIAAGKFPPRDRDVTSCFPYMMRLSADTGDITMHDLATTLSAQLPVQRPVIDKTGLTGSYRITLTFDMRGSILGLEAAPAAQPSLFTALQDQLGLKLESTKIMRETVVVDHIERPTED